MTTIGAKIKELREDSGMSQADLARLAGLAPAAISRYELGTRQPSVDVIVKIAAALNASPYSLVPLLKDDQERMQRMQTALVNSVIELARKGDRTDAELKTILEIKNIFDEELKKSWNLALVADSAQLAIEQKAEQERQRIAARQEMKEKRNTNRRFDQLYPIFVTLSEENQKGLLDMAYMMKDAQEYRRLHPAEEEGTDQHETDA